MQKTKKLRDWGDLLEEISHTEPLLWSYAVWGLETASPYEMRKVLKTIEASPISCIEEDIVSALLDGFPCISSEEQIAIRQRSRGSRNE